MEAFLNVTVQRPSEFEDRRNPPEIHQHDVLHGDLITLESMGQRYQVHVAAITPETLVLEIQGLRLTEEHRRGHTSSFRRYVLPRNSSLSLSTPTQDKGPTWTFEWTGHSVSN